ncbi:MAG: hypothetical protein E4H01_09135 [Lysobacterales bacterium]|nr:MAG: hypothetical protein E4H01_09135 [Xanthomonadales bacterium]
MATLYQAHAKMTSGNNDVCVLIGNGAAGGSARLSAALATSIDSTATVGTLLWTKNACHLIGTGAPTMVGQRARIAPPSGTYTVTTFGAAAFITVSGAGCIFSNISVFNGFSTGGAAQIAWTDTGQRNYYENMNIYGMADTTSAADAGSRSLKIGSGGNGEHTFVNCVIGGDTVTRGAANASLEFAGATPRNTFKGCVFPMSASAATPLFGIGTGAGCVDRYQLFDNCIFINAMDSGATALTGAFTLPASAGGSLVMKNCSLVGDGSANWGTDATTLAQMYVDGAAPTAGTSGLAVNPT